MKIKLTIRNQNENKSLLVLAIAFIIFLLLFLTPPPSPSCQTSLLKTPSTNSSPIDINFIFHNLNPLSRYATLTNLTTSISTQAAAHTAPNHLAHKISLYLYTEPTLSHLHPIECAADLVNIALSAEAVAARDFAATLRSVYAESAYALGEACSAHRDGEMEEMEIYHWTLGRLAVLLAPVKRPLHALALAGTLSEAAVQGFADSVRGVLAKEGSNAVQAYTMTGMGEVRSRRATDLNARAREEMAARWFVAAGVNADGDYGVYTKDLEAGLGVGDLLAFVVKGLSRSNTWEDRQSEMMMEVQGLTSVLHLVADHMMDGSFVALGTECERVFEDLRTMLEDGMRMMKEDDGVGDRIW